MILLFLISYVNGSNVTCTRLINRMILDYQIYGQEKLLQDMLPYTSLSGNGDLKWGYYDACLRNNHSYTSMRIEATDNPIESLSFGFCHSKDCTTQDLDSTHGQKIIKELIFIIFNVSLDNAQIVYFDPLEPNDYDFGFWITCLILLTFVGFSLAYPMIQYYEGFRKRRLIKYINDSTEIDAEQEIFQQEQVKLQQEVGWLQEFSVFESYKTLTDFKIPDPNLVIMDGIRTIAFFMVIGGHVYLTSAFVSYIQDVGLFLKTWSFIYLGDMFYSVDMFFWLGGFFIGFILYEKSKVDLIHKKPEGLLMIIIHRLLRIWPCYVIAMMINSYIGPHFGEGPRWQIMSLPQFVCKTPMRSLLFIDNFFDDSSCMVWGWYLTNDIQMFLVGLVSLYIYSFSRFYGKLSIAFLLVTTQVVGIILSFLYELTVPGLSLLVNGPDFYKYYFKAYCRAPPYYLGLLIGILYREYKQTRKDPTNSYLHQLHNASKQKTNRYIIQAVCYITGFGLIIAMSIGWRPVQRSRKIDDEWPRWFQSLWHGFCRTILIIGLTLVIIPSMIGIKDLVVSFLGCRFFRFSAKISFCGYLFHFIWLIVIGGIFYETPEYNNQELIHTFIGMTLITYISAILMALFIEIPLGKLEKRLLTFKKSKPVQQKRIPEIKDELL
ncbi:hypothetical protein pb186bvf_018760 [Paramecium bursaria]